MTKLATLKKDVKYSEVYEKYDHLMANNFKEYRAALKTRGSDTPCLPYLGVYLSDLTFIEDGNQDLLEMNGHKQINFGKRAMITKIIKDIKRYNLSLSLSLFLSLSLSFSLSLSLSLSLHMMVILHFDLMCILVT